MGMNFYKDGRTKQILSDETLRKLYYSWVGIRRRAGGKCFSEGDRHKKVYQNINVCESWNDWNNYKDWALKNGYKKGLSIDRIDNMKGYNPENCRWVTTAENNRNKKNTKKFMYNGQLLTLGQIAQINNVDKNMLYARVINYGWDLDKALIYKRFQSVKNKNIDRNRNMLKDFNNGMTIKDLAVKYNMCERNVYDCIKII